MSGHSPPRFRSVSELQETFTTFSLLHFRRSALPGDQATRENVGEVKGDFASTRADRVEPGDGLVVDETKGAETFVGFKTSEREPKTWTVPLVRNYPESPARHLSRRITARSGEFQRPDKS